MLMMQRYSPPKPIKNIQFSGRLTLLLTIVEISDCLTRTIRNTLKPILQKQSGHKTVLCESSDFECKCHKLSFFFLGVVRISVCTDICIQALCLILMVLVNIIICGSSRHGLVRKRPVQAICVN